jgi:hypothetical protein
MGSTMQTAVRENSWLKEFRQGQEDQEQNGKGVKIGNLLEKN